MEIDEQTIQSLFAEQHITKGMITHANGTIGLSLLIERLTAGINATLSTAEQVGFLKEELLGLQERYEENCAELDMEMGRLVKACKHPSWTECEKDGLPLVICNICGGIVEEEICGIQ